MKYLLINTIYFIFKNRREEIQNNENIINLARIKQNDLYNKVEELKNRFNSYDLRNRQTTIDSIGKLSQNIESIT